MARPRRTVFVVDGIGAALSTAATGTILLALQPWFGMPRSTLLWLTLMAAAFAAYSLNCWSRRTPLFPWLPIVMAANLAYCGFLAAAMVRHATALTPLGLAYFAGELGIIVGVVLYEGRALRADSTCV